MSRCHQVLKTIAVIAVVITGSLLVGCTTVTTSSLVGPCRGQAGSASDCNSGLAYSLPKAQVLVSASRYQVISSDPDADFAKAKADLSRTQALDGYAKNQVDEAEITLKMDDAAKASKGQIKSDNAVLAQAREFAQSVRERLLAAKRAVPLAEAVVDAQVKARRFSDAVSRDASGIAVAQSTLVTDISKPAKPATITEDRKSLAQAQAALVADQASLDDATRDLEVAQAAFPKWKESVTLTVLSNIPDPTARYVANLSHEPTRDDTLKLSVVNGLLNSSTVTSTDQTPNLLIQLADSAITLGAFAPVAPVAPAAPAAPAAPGAVRPRPAPPKLAVPAQPGMIMPAAGESPPIDCAYDLVRSFDPLNASSIGKLQRDLKAHGSNISVVVDAGPASGAKVPLSAGRVDGLVYRIATPVMIRTVTEADATFSGAACPLEALPTAQSVMAVVPDSRSSFVVHSSAGMFTTTNLSFGFSGGMLTDYTAQRPSEIAAIAGIPVRIAQDLVSIPGNMLQLRVNYDTQATALVAAQTALQQAQINRATAVTGSQTALVSAQTALQQAQLAQPTAVVTSQTALVNAKTGLEEAQLARPADVIASQTALVNAETALQQAQIGQPTAVATAKAALVTAMTNLQQAQAGQPTAAVNAQTTLIQAHAALIQAEQALQNAISSYQSAKAQSSNP